MPGLFWHPRCRAPLVCEVVGWLAGLGWLLSATSAECEVAEPPEPKSLSFGPVKQPWIASSFFLSEGDPRGCFVSFVNAFQLREGNEARG